jgi:AcrR family transcriptional regulator
MAYPAGHRAAVRKRIINSARKLFNRRGFECVSLNQIMAGVGLNMVCLIAISKARALCMPKY